MTEAEILAAEQRCCNSVPKERSKSCRRCRRHFIEPESVRREFEREHNDGEALPDSFYEHCDLDAIVEDTASYLEKLRWHDVRKDPDDLPENGQWCAVLYTSGVDRFTHGTLARWYDGNIATAWHDWLLELMPPACFYEPIVNGGIGKITIRGMEAVLAWMPIEMDEKYWEQN